jgi:hypothetical protein
MVIKLKMHVDLLDLRLVRPSSGSNHRHALGRPTGRSMARRADAPWLLAYERGRGHHVVLECSTLLLGRRTHDGYSQLCGHAPKWAGEFLSVISGWRSRTVLSNSATCEDGAELLRDSSRRRAPGTEKPHASSYPFNTDKSSLAWILWTLCARAREQRTRSPAEESQPLAIERVVAAIKGL